MLNNYTCSCGKPAQIACKCSSNLNFFCFTHLEQHMQNDSDSHIPLALAHALSMQDPDLRIRNIQLDKIEMNLLNYQKELENHISGLSSVHNTLKESIDQIFEDYYTKYSKTLRDVKDLRNKLEEYKVRNLEETKTMIEKYKTNKIRGILPSFEEVSPINMLDILQSLSNKCGLSRVQLLQLLDRDLQEVRPTNLDKTQNHTHTSHINLTLGTVGNEPGLYIDQQLKIGGQENAELRAKVQSEVGSELQDYSLYYVVPCVSASQATMLKNKLTEIYNKAVEKKNKGIAPTNIVESEFAYWNLHFESNRNNVIIKVTMPPAKYELARTNIEMVNSQFSDLLENSQSVHFELSLAATAQDLLRSPNLVLVLGQGAKIHLEVNHTTACAERVYEVLQAVAAPDEIKFLLGAFSLFRHLNLNFKSLDDLPSNMKGVISSASQELKQLITGFNNGLQGENQNLVNFLKQFGDGSSQLFFVTPKFISSTYFKLPGLSSFLDAQLL